jgi:hypothetical protein
VPAIRGESVGKQGKVIRRQRISPLKIAPPTKWINAPPKYPSLRVSILHIEYGRL